MKVTSKRADPSPMHFLLEALHEHSEREEPWGLRRFFFRDPAGNLVNVVDS